MRAWKFAGLALTTLLVLAGTLARVRAPEPEARPIVVPPTSFEVSADRALAGAVLRDALSVPIDPRAAVALSSRGDTPAQADLLDLAFPQLAAAPPAALPEPSYAGLALIAVAGIRWARACFRPPR